jgi:hypothetical protein
MPLWGKYDNASNSDIAAVGFVNRHIDTANQTALYANTRTGEFFNNMKIGQFAIGVAEEQANPAIPHSGWVLKKEGTGGRAGRVTYEVLVAAGSAEFGLPDGDAGVIGNYSLAFTTQPTANSGQAGNTLTYFARAVTTPAGGTVAYQWYNNGVKINNGGVFSGNNTNTLSVIARANVNNNVFTATANVSGAVANITSTGATLTITA